ncbi:MAG: 16S rRNA (uracil(1498)-N(3))-methyltransferase [Alphaproteobacteria bacterium]|nr:16S rRNA (uracil(1498)-N(3))-methyltransferase [Alphaproteobacteria bacterium]
MSETTPGPRLPKLRLFVADDLDAGAAITLGRDQSHYITNVMRAAAGDEIALFNGRDGEWAGEITTLGKRTVDLSLTERLRDQVSEPDLWLAFAPIKRGRIDFVAAKATELGVSRLIPVMTARTQMSRVNTGRLLANAIEAAEQCERLTVPAVSDPVSLADILSGWPADRRLFVGDETGTGQPIAEAAGDIASGASQPCGILVGPEGGFTPDELDDMGKLAFVTKIGLGPRVMRADTAAIAALSVIQAIAGDWRDSRSR